MSSLWAAGQPLGDTGRMKGRRESDRERGKERETERERLLLKVA